MWYLISLVSPTLQQGDAVRVSTEYPYQASCQRALADELNKRRQAFDKEGKIVIWETCVHKETQELAQNAH